MLNKTRRVARRLNDNEPNSPNEHILVIDTGGGHISTITKSSCLVLHHTNHCTELIGYQDKASPRRHPIVHCAIKVKAPNLDQPIILVLNYVSLLEDESETESLLQPFSCMRHGVRMDLTPLVYGGESGMRIDGQFIAFDFDREKLFLPITYLQTNMGRHGLFRHLRNHFTPRLGIVIHRSTTTTQTTSHIRRHSY